MVNFKGVDGKTLSYSDYKKHIDWEHFYAKPIIPWGFDVIYLLLENHQSFNKEIQSFISEIKKFKIEYIDLRQIMELADNPMGFHFKNDGHWTRKAHNIAGVALAKRINSRYTHNNNFIK